MEEILAQTPNDESPDIEAQVGQKSLSRLTSSEKLAEVPLTKNHAKQLAQKIRRANYRRNRLEYYLVFSKNIHWIIYWPSVALPAMAGCAAFVNFQQTAQCNNIGWLIILTGVVSILAAALTAINGAARFPAREQICREFIVRWGSYADRYTTLLNKRYRDMQETSKIVEQAIEEFAELEIKSPDIPTIVMKLYKRSSIAKEIDEGHQDTDFDFNSSPELLSPSEDEEKKTSDVVIEVQPNDAWIPDLQKELDARSVDN